MYTPVKWIYPGRYRPRARIIAAINYDLNTRRLTRSRPPPPAAHRSPRWTLLSSSLCPCLLLFVRSSFPRLQTLHSKKTDVCFDLSCEDTRTPSKNARAPDRRANSSFTSRERKFRSPFDPRLGRSHCDTYEFLRAD